MVTYTLTKAEDTSAYEAYGTWAFTLDVPNEHVISGNGNLMSQLKSPTLNMKRTGGTGIAGGSVKWGEFHFYIDCYVNGTKVGYYVYDYNEKDITTGVNTEVKHTKSYYVANTNTGDIWNDGSVQRELDITYTFRPIPSSVGRYPIFSKGIDQWGGGICIYGYLQSYSSANFSATIKSKAILNAPPSCEYTQLTESSGRRIWVENVSEAQTTISNINAQYGGSITSITLTVGTSVASTPVAGTIDVPIVEHGEIMPQIIVTDSRGQTTTYILDSISVQAYTIPTISTLSINRENEHDVSGVAVSDIAFVLTCGYTQMSGNTLGTPTVKVNGTVTQVSWYTDATRETLYTGTWTGASPLTLYGVVSGMYQTINEYNVSVTIADSFATSEEKTEVLPTVFVTMDFQAGGKEIAFGDKADDSLTNYPRGLFKCSMDMLLRGVRVPTIFISQSDPTSADGDDGDIWIIYQ